MKKGFTLIELLVVITIIGILATISIMSFGNIQAKSRDSQRKSDLSKIAAAMELYKTDKKVYPDTKDASLRTQWMVVGTGTVEFGSKLTAGNYLASIPKNPKGNPYMIISDGKTYKIIVTSESNPTQSQAGEYYDARFPKCLQVSPDTTNAGNTYDSYCS